MQWLRHTRGRVAGGANLNIWRTKPCERETSSPAALLKREVKTETWLSRASQVHGEPAPASSLRLATGIGCQAGWHPSPIRPDIGNKRLRGPCLLTALEWYEWRPVRMQSGTCHRSQCPALDKMAWGGQAGLPSKGDWSFGTSGHPGALVHLGRDWNMLCFSEEGAGPHGQNWRGLAGWAEGPCRQRAHSAARWVFPRPPVLRNRALSSSPCPLLPADYWGLGQAGAQTHLL